MGRNGHSRDGGIKGGAGGAYVEGLYDVSSITGANIVIGAGGAAVVAGNSGNGGDGGDTTIVDLGISAGGGRAAIQRVILLEVLPARPL
ncbi:hypothetical protein [Klebsiella pneumoniae]|uniref:hypothetical protein n=1 Tax=Klebsiella pneumoniae TaxID=573 RepID=UPI003A5CD98A